MRKLILLLLPFVLSAQISTFPPSNGGSGSGTVNSGTVGQVGIYTANGTAITGISFEAINPQTSNYQVLAADFTNRKVITVSSGSPNVTLVASGTQPANGQRIKILNYGTGQVTIKRSGQNINGSTADIVLPASSAGSPNAAFVVSDGTNYFVSLEQFFNAATFWANTGCIDTGSVNVITCNTSFTFPQNDGATLIIHPANTNTGATTLNINGVGAHAVINPLGAALSGGELVTGGFYIVTLSGSATSWQLQSGGGTGLPAGCTGSSGSISCTGSYTSGSAGGVSGKDTFSGATSGAASISVPSVAGTPNDILLPTTTGSNGNALITNGANPQQTSWGLCGTNCADTSYLNTLYAQIAASNAWTSAGAPQLFPSSSTRGPIRLGTGSIPTAMLSSEFYADTSSHVGISDGTLTQTFVTVAGPSNTAIATAPTSGNSIKWNGGFNVIDSGVPFQLFQTNAKTATYQVLASDFADCKTIPVASGTFTITLVASGSQPASGQCIDIINYGSGVVTVARSGQNINGAAANLTLAAGSASAPTGIHIVSDATNYVAQTLGGAGGSVANYYTSTTFTGIGPTSFTPSVGTLQIYDATASTGSTLFSIRAGAGQSGNLFEIRDGTTNAYFQWNGTGSTFPQAKAYNSQHIWYNDTPQGSPTDKFDITVRSTNGALVQASSDSQIGFNSNTANSGTCDTCFNRDTAGVLQLNNGTAGPQNSTALIGSGVGNVSPVTVNANVSTDQNLMTYTIPANYLNHANRTMRIWVAGTYTTVAANVSTINIKAKICTVSGCGSGTVLSVLSITSTANAGGLTTVPWNLIGDITTQTAGASSVYESHGNLVIDLTAVAAADSIFTDGNTAVSSTIDSTAQLFLQITGAFSSASGSNSFTQRQMVVEFLN